MTRALTLMANIAKHAKEAVELLTRAEDKQVAMEIKFAAEAVIEGNKYQPKAHSQEHRD